MGVAPAECLVVEEAVSGIQAAHAAGMDAVAVPTTFTPEDLRAQAGPEYLIPEIKALSQLPELEK